jgi:xanthine dehydrogenase accessory factor
MCCGGVVKIFIEPIMKTNKLYIFGAGHTGKALSRIMTELNFDTYIIDDRKEYIDKITDEKVNKINLSYKEILPTLPFDKNTFITIMTYEHSHDRDILSYCLKKDFAYLGMIGSKRKVSLTKKMFIDGDICTKEEIKKVDMPMGIDINAEGPEEIAISIASKIIAIKNK